MQRTGEPSSPKGMDAAVCASFLARCVASLPALGSVQELRTAIDAGGAAPAVALQAALEVCAEVLVYSPRGVEIARACARTPQPREALLDLAARGALAFAGPRVAWSDALAAVGCGRTCGRGGGGPSRLRRAARAAAVGRGARPLGARRRVAGAVGRRRRRRRGRRRDAARSWRTSRRCARADADPPPRRPGAAAAALEEHAPRDAPATGPLVLCEALADAARAAHAPVGGPGGGAVAARAVVPAERGAAGAEPRGGAGRPPAPVLPGRAARARRPPRSPLVRPSSSSSCSTTTPTRALVGYHEFAEDGSFVWRRGPLAAAAARGDWVLVEDADRAPVEVLALLKPLARRGVLSAPGRALASEHVTFDARDNGPFLARLRDCAARGRWAKLGDGCAEGARRAPPRREEAAAGGAKRSRTTPPGAAATSARAGPPRATPRAPSPRAARGAAGPGRVRARRVGAARGARGDWVLLDELNLAPGDVLQRLGPLLEGDFPRAHDALRVFGAMNPAGDAGKRELPPALRSRFTELFVEEPSDDGDLEAIAARRLAPLFGHRADGAVAARRRGARRRKACVALHRTSGPRGGRRRRPRAPGRRGAAAALLAAHALPRATPRRAAGHCRKGGAAAALREGFELAYATQLVGDGPGGGRRAAADAVATLRRWRRWRRRRRGAAAARRRRRLRARRALLAPAGPGTGAATGRGRARAACALTATSREPPPRRRRRGRSPVLLQGPTCAGKTTLVEYVAARLGVVCARVNNHEHTDVAEYVGRFAPEPDGSIGWRDGALTAALRRGEWLLLDELNLAPPDVLEALNRLLDDNRELRIPETGEVVRPAPGFALFATQNPRAEASDFLGALRPARRGSGALFEWVDGALVAAMKAGAFVLLDELNLADDAVLERLNSVLEPGRSVTLAEKGGEVLETVVAHADFRVVATMNPGGDHGKRELSPALRSRFTELWAPTRAAKESDIPNFKGFDLGRFPLVPTCAGRADLGRLVDARLPRLGADGAAVRDAILDFKEWVDGAGRWPRDAVPPLTPRDLGAWAQFADEARARGLAAAAALGHGCAVACLDGIGLANAAPPRRRPRRGRGRRASRARPRARPAAPSPPTSRPRCAGTRRARRPRAPRFARRRRRRRRCAAGGGGFCFVAPTTAANARRVLRACVLPRAVLLEGPPGVGKSASAAARGRALHRVNLSEHTDLGDLLGGDLPCAEGAVAAFEWRDGPLLTAVRRGDWVLLDELNLAPQPVLEGLNAVLDHRAALFVPELGESFPCAPGFRLFATQNPAADGNAGRRGLPKSFVDRFGRVAVEGLGPADLVAIASHAYALDDAEGALGPARRSSRSSGLGAGRRRQRARPRALAAAKGAWLVLDDANLCPPSVLDRLNALLEPGGALALAEGGAVGGEHRVVAPAPGFRVFLTVDPSFGGDSAALAAAAARADAAKRADGDSFLDRGQGAVAALTLGAPRDAARPTSARCGRRARRGPRGPRGRRRGLRGRGARARCSATAPADGAAAAAEVRRWSSRRGGPRATRAAPALAALDDAADAAVAALVARGGGAAGCASRADAARARGLGRRRRRRGGGARALQAPALALVRGAPGWPRAAADAEAVAAFPPRDRRRWRAAARRSGRGGPRGDGRRRGRAPRGLRRPRDGRLGPRGGPAVPAPPPADWRWAAAARRAEAWADRAVDLSPGDGDGDGDDPPPRWTTTARTARSCSGRGRRRRWRPTALTAGPLQCCQLWDPSLARDECAVVALLADADAGGPRAATSGRGSSGSRRALRCPRRRRTRRPTPTSPGRAAGPEALRDAVRVSLPGVVAACRRRPSRAGAADAARVRARAAPGAAFECGGDADCAVAGAPSRARAAPPRRGGADAARQGLVRAARWRAATPTPGAADGFAGGDGDPRVAALVGGLLRGDADAARDAGAWLDVAGAFADDLERRHAPSRPTSRCPPSLLRRRARRGAPAGAAAGAGPRLGLPFGAPAPAGASLFALRRGARRRRRRRLGPFLARCGLLAAWRADDADAGDDDDGDRLDSGFLRRGGDGGEPGRPRRRRGRAARAALPRRRARGPLRRLLPRRRRALRRGDGRARAPRGRARGRRRRAAAGAPGADDGARRWRAGVALGAAADALAPAAPADGAAGGGGGDAPGAALRGLGLAAPLTRAAASARWRSGGPRRPCSRAWDLLREWPRNAVLERVARVADALAEPVAPAPPRAAPPAAALAPGDGAAAPVPGDAALFPALAGDGGGAAAAAARRRGARGPAGAAAGRRRWRCCPLAARMRAVAAAPAARRGRGRGRRGRGLRRGHLRALAYFATASGAGVKRRAVAQAALRDAVARPRDVGPREASLLRALGEHLGVVALRQRAALAAAAAAALRGSSARRARRDDAALDEFRGPAADPLAPCLELVDEADEVAGEPPLPADDPLPRGARLAADGATPRSARRPRLAARAAGRGAAGAAAAAALAAAAAAAPRGAARRAAAAPTAPLTPRCRRSASRPSRRRRRRPSSPRRAPPSRPSPRSASRGSGPRSRPRRWRRWPAAPPSASRRSTPPLVAAAEDLLRELAACHRETAKLHYVVARVARTLLALGFCGGDDDDGRARDGDGYEDCDGTGMGDGDLAENAQDVSGEIDNEEQLLGTKPDAADDADGGDDDADGRQAGSSRATRDEGVEMGGEFDGDKHDVGDDDDEPDDRDDRGGDDDDGDGDGESDAEGAGDYEDAAPGDDGGDGDDGVEDLPEDMDIDAPPAAGDDDGDAAMDDAGGDAEDVADDDDDAAAAADDAAADDGDDAADADAAAPPRGRRWRRAAAAASAPQLAEEHRARSSRPRTRPTRSAPRRAPAAPRCAGATRATRAPAAATTLRAEAGGRWRWRR
ncbi:ATPase [Aureococcus anophagefferens]|nr:ATPase [Aureococcus anophagefferens]